MPIVSVARTLSDGGVREELAGSGSVRWRTVTRRQRLTLLAAILGSGMAMLDGSVVTSLSGDRTRPRWPARRAAVGLNAYLLTLGSLILVGGSLGDIYGERRVFSLGVAAFGVFSVACAFAPTSEVLVASRALQGAAAALVTPSSLAVIVAAFPTRVRGPAIGTWTAWVGIAAIVGPLAGGLIVDRASWRWIFALNVPIVILTVALILVAVPPEAPTRGKRVDYLGAAYCAIGLGGIVFALIEQPSHGWSSIVIVAPLAVGLLSLAAFVAHELRTAEPMLDPALFRRRNFSVGNVETLAMYAALSILFFFLVIFLQQVAGYSALEAGLATLPTTLVMFVLSRRFGALADRHGPRLFMGLGPIVSAVGIAMLLGTGIDTSYLVDVLPALMVFSVGLSLTVAPLTAAILADAGAREAGIASAVNNAVARIAGLIGVSVVGLIVATTLVGNTFEANLASVRAFHQVVVICALLMSVGGLVGLVGITNTKVELDAEHCSGGQLYGAPEPAATEEANSGLRARRIRPPRPSPR